jgi:hypothetical protein
METEDATVISLSSSGMKYPSDISLGAIVESKNHRVTSMVL